MANTILKKRSILSKTFQVGFLTFLSRILGLAREVLQARFLGVGALSDAFIIAFKLPNSLRKIFAEGALSAAFVPTFLQVFKTGNKRDSDSLASLTFIFFEGILILLCLLVFIYTESVIRFMASGFSQEQISFAVSYLRILMPFIVFVSSSSLLSGVLQSVNHFFVPAAAPAILNIFFIGALIFCSYYNLSVEFLCYVILFSGCFTFFLHLFVYFYFNFSFAPINKSIFPYFTRLLIKFFPVMLIGSIMEINLAIDTWFSSFLTVGSVSLVTYAFRFMNIPLGVFGVALSTILLPHFSRIADYAPKRLGFYFLESMKLVFWVTIPMTIFMSVFSSQIFITTIAMSGKFPFERLKETCWLLIIFLVGLFFASFIKVLLNIYYAKHDTLTPALISCSVVLVNFILNYLLIGQFKTLGLALGTTVSMIMQMILLSVFLNKKYGLNLYINKFFVFLTKYIFQLSIALCLFSMIYFCIEELINLLPANLVILLTQKILLWGWLAPLIGFTYLFMLKTKKYFGVKMYFLD
ncbi:murein biosynthesis integral membrane protein MurJ [candidate division TM6 bacterium RIFCSPHIGHO2_12_FULL_32_22]|nr:MAG: murein biosynthesis integral membrane protein MurJ [candidate division TM6 bacterium RIFCSPHIGHO2_12_FULL_32_22]